MEFSTIETALAGEEMFFTWDRTLTKWKSGCDEKKGELRGWIEDRVRFFLRVAEEVDDEEDRLLVTVIRYIEVKSGWIQLNHLINHKLNTTGIRDEEAMYRASLLSRTLKRIESLLDADKMNEVTHSLAEPVEQLSEDEACSGGASAIVTPEAVRIYLIGAEIEALWAETLDALEELTDQERERYSQWIRERRDKFVDTLALLEHPDDIKNVLAALYMESKAAWMQMNHMMNYMMVNRGEYDQRLMCEASLLTKILVVVEQILTEDDLNRLTQFLAQPFP